VRRSGPLRRHTRLGRRTRIKPRDAARAAVRRERGFGKRAEAVRSMVCLVHTHGRAEQCMSRGCGWSDPAHVRSRGAGGTRRDLVPLCRACHMAQHSEGIRSFEARVGLDLAEHAARIAAELDGEGLP